MTFVATANAVLMAGATPVFADVDPETGCLTVDTAEAKITDKTDILMITDGHSDVHDHTIRNINAMKERTGAMWSTICIETDPGPSLNRFSDEVHTVDLTKTAESIDCIQRCIR